MIVEQSYQSLKVISSFDDLVFPICFIYFAYKLAHTKRVLIRVRIGGFCYQHPIYGVNSVSSYQCGEFLLRRSKSGHINRRMKLTINSLVSNGELI